MGKYKEKLEVRYRLVRIKKFKKAIYALQLILLFLLSAFFIYQYGSFVPFFIPLDLIILLVLIIAFALCIESIFFRATEIFYAKESSTKHLMTSNSIKKSIGIIIAFAIIFTLLFTPRFVSIIENEISIQKNDLWINATDIRRDFSSEDALGLTKVINLTVEVGSGEVDVTIHQKDGILINMSVPEGNSTTFNIEKSIEGYEELTLVINNTAGSGGSEVNYTIKSSLSSDFVAIIPILAVFFIIINIVWLAFLFPLKKRYAPRSIFSKRYVALKDVGVEVWSERGSLVIKKGDRIIPLYQEEEVQEEEVLKPKIKPERPVKPTEKKIKEEAKFICPSCNTEIDPDSTSCLKCGVEFGGEPVEQFECPSCSAMVDPSAAVCPKCGMEFAEETEEHEEKIPKLLKEKKEEGKLTGDIMCPSCGVLNSPYASLCYSCGSRIREMEMEEKDKDNAYETLMNIPNIGTAKAKCLYDAGFKNLADIKNSSIDELSKIKGISKNFAKEIIEYLKNH